MPHFTTLQLNEERLSEAFPLVRMAIPEVDPVNWIEYCESLLRLGGGVFAATTPDGAMHGVAAYRPEVNLRFGKVIRVDMLVAFELSPANPVREALCASLNAVCQDIEAQGIVLTIPSQGHGDTASPKGRSLERAGFHREAALLWKGCREDHPNRLDRNFDHA